MDAITLAWTEAGQRKTQTFVDAYSTKNPGTIRVGRDPAQCDVVLPSLSASDRTVSRLHVEIVFNPTHSSFYLRNLKPQNPVQVDGSAVVDEAVLQEGSIIRLGKVEVEVASVAAVPATIFVSASERPTLVYKPAEDTQEEAERSEQHQSQSKQPQSKQPQSKQPEGKQPENRQPASGAPPAEVQPVQPEQGRAGSEASANGGGESLRQLADRAQERLESIPRPTLSMQTFLRPVPLTIAAAIVAAVGVLQWQRINTITSTKAFVNSRVIPIDAPVSGELRLQNINSGQPVQEGVLLGNIYDPRNIDLQRTQQRLKIDLENLITRQRQLQVQLQGRRNSLQLLDDEANAQQSLRQGSVEFLEAELDDAVQAAQDAEADLARLEELAEEGAVTQQEVELAEIARDRADDVVVQLRVQLADARQGNGNVGQTASVATVVESRRAALRDEIRNFEQVLGNLQAEADRKQREFDSVTDRLARQTPANITSPADGEIWTVDYQPELSNTVVVSGDRIAELAVCEGLWVEALVSARDASNIAEGSDATIFIPGGLRRQTFAGVVREIRTASDPIGVNDDEVAISPEALAAGEVAVIVEPESPDELGGYCNIGRTTEVRFPRN